MWNRIKTFFSDSETIFLARLQMFIGAVGAVTASMDWMSLVMGYPSKHMLILFGASFAHGVLMEYLRRRRATDL